MDTLFLSPTLVIRIGALNSYPPSLGAVMRAAAIANSFTHTSITYYCAPDWFIRLFL